MNRALSCLHLKLMDISFRNNIIGIPSFFYIYVIVYNKTYYWAILIFGTYKNVKEGKDCLTKVMTLDSSMNLKHSNCLFPFNNSKCAHKIDWLSSSYPPFLGPTHCSKPSTPLSTYITWLVNNNLFNQKWKVIFNNQQTKVFPCIKSLKLT